MWKSQIGSKRTSQIFSQEVFSHQIFWLFVIFSRFVLSGSLHGGTVGASFPFDDGSASPGLIADEDLFHYLAQTYTENHPIMSMDNPDCPVDPNKSFGDGITNCWTLKSGILTKWNSIELWFGVAGGMQDFNYHKGNCFEVTFKFSCCKYPPASQLYTEWTNNKEALLTFIQKVSWLECFSM